MYLTHTSKICYSNKYAPQMPHVCHMPKFLDAHLWEMYINIHATYEVALFNDVARINVQE